MFVVNLEGEIFVTASLAPPADLGKFFHAKNCPLSAAHVLIISASGWPHSVLNNYLTPYRASKIQIGFGKGAWNLCGLKTPPGRRSIGVFRRGVDGTP